MEDQYWYSKLNDLISITTHVDCKSNGFDFKLNFLIDMQQLYTTV